MLEGGLRVAQLVAADDEVLVRVERLAWSDEVVTRVMVRRPAVHEQNGVVLGGVELAVGDVGDPEIGDDSAVLELEIAQVRHLVLRLPGPMGAGDLGGRQEQGRQWGAQPRCRFDCDALMLSPSPFLLPQGERNLSSVASPARKRDFHYRAGARLALWSLLP